ncbi:hypothetical protein [Candidatus Nitrosacidococcus sp. I8]|uniref:restriction endonuclease n=1 Tax=Candidatus Nitrosacidococcus sp. I8 TaxID=2942908 RepID=UPI002226DCE3|nr:hypothetical protein [Candidatus Nitrosacidococcus sp. I8]CAH9018718.1 hypothetical protein NURINAE_01093 [Candidatus Nitrosacidococcus sp. I8]
MKRNLRHCLLVFFKSDGLEKQLKEDYLKIRQAKIEVKNNQASSHPIESVSDGHATKITTLSYSQFLTQLATSLSINRITLHQAMGEAMAELNINQYLNATTLRAIKGQFNTYLMTHAIDKFSIDYQQISNQIHPTKLTDCQGNVLKEINGADIGICCEDEAVADNYFFEELYYDSELEKENIQAHIKEVIVFTKIPKNSIRIPVAGGTTYSPDFAYVIEYTDGKKKLNFIIESKGIESDEELRAVEKAKIDHARRFFGKSIDIQFKTQFSQNKMIDLIEEIRSQCH